MKPTKSRIFCREAQRSKMLFESQKKAENFMQYNSKEILSESGYAPVRSYHCIACAGWHLTSRREELDLPSKTELVLEAYKEVTDEKDKAKGLCTNGGQEKDTPSANALQGLRKKIELIRRSLKNKGSKTIITKLIEEASKSLENLEVTTQLKKSKRELEVHLSRLESRAMLLPDDEEAGILTQIRVIERLLDNKGNRILIRNLIYEALRGLRNMDGAMLQQYSKKVLEEMLKNLALRCDQLRNNMSG